MEMEQVVTKIHEESLFGKMTTSELNIIQSDHFIIDDHIRVMLKDLSIDQKKEVADKIREMRDGFKA